MDRQRIPFDGAQTRLGLYIPQIFLAETVVSGLYSSTNNWERAAYIGFATLFLVGDVVAERIFRNIERYNESVR